MLQRLSIRNYALIDSVELEPDGGLNIITGETGAGKSIILGALSLILGQRAETRFFFNQDRKCIIEGHFLLKNEALKGLFDSNDIDFGTETILRREISTDGKSRAFINDTPVNLSLMKQVGEQLIDIHSQHATLELNDPEFQLLVVDTLADHQGLLDDYRAKFRLFQKTQHKLKSLRELAIEANSRQDYEQYLFNELDAARLSSGEQEVLEQELETLTHAEQIKHALVGTYNIISEQEISALPLLKQALSQLSSVERFNTQYAEMAERLRSSLIEIKDISDEVLSAEESIIFDPARIEEINLRLSTIYALQQKHKVSSVEALIAIKQDLSDRLEAISAGDDEITQIEAELKALEEELRKIAGTLADNRGRSIANVEGQLAEILVKVGMPKAKIVIAHEIGTQLHKDGLDHVKLMFSANNGQNPAPIGKVASGGELSRLMLAIKSVLAQHTSLPTMIFDEIDTGISGEIAMRVGDVISDLQRNMQVICITHLPQIAAKGHSHYFVYKQEDQGKTNTGIRKLDFSERVLAIAEMLSGKDPGESAISHAKDLLEN
ncbi:DNA repair protein RecN [Pedobacter faecalis]|uniref:DNA repair protein RecN n=1 Tax=Pedobacter faecalis TaxID=3041495 RepID=UPI00254FC336|nr:DNA repair protein RecN [Pedobacter sp. ELA7]